MISGRIIIDRVKAPARSDIPHPRAVTKNSIPNKPYTMDGMPERVSAVTLISFTNLFSLLAYSTRKIAEKIPIGAAMDKEITIIRIVFINEGIREPLVELYSHSNKDRLMCG